MENAYLQDLIQAYKMSEIEHKDVLTELKKSLFSGKITIDEPSAMFVIGQPGCGKTTFINKSDLSNYTIINSDNYRKFNKFSSYIMSKYPTYYTKLTNYDAHLLGDELFSYGLENGYSVLREKAPVNDDLLKLIESLSFNYKVIINVVVAGNLTSLLATRERYEQEILQEDNARLSNIESHNICYELLPNFILQCLQLGVDVNYVIPTMDDFEIVPVGSNYLNLLKTYRFESNMRTINCFSKKIDDIKKSMLNRNAPQDQFDELEKIENIYNNMKNDNFSDGESKECISEINL